MKRLILFIQITVFTSILHAGDNICFDENNAFLTQAPVGWVADTAKAKELGLCAVYVVKGKDFDSSPAIIYPRLGGTANEGKAAVEEFILESTALLKDSKTLKVLTKPAIKNKSGLKFEIRHFLNGPPPNDFEAIAYHAGKKAVLVLVLSTRSEKAFDSHRMKLAEFVKTIKPLSQKELEKYKNK